MNLYLTMNLYMMYGTDYRDRDIRTSYNSPVHGVLRISYCSQVWCTKD